MAAKSLHHPCCIHAVPVFEVVFALTPVFLLCVARHCRAALETQAVAAIKWDLHICKLASSLVKSESMTTPMLWCFDTSFASSCPAAVWFAVYVLFMYTLYSCMPVVVKMTSATAVNLSLLTADLFSLFCGIFLFHHTVSVIEKHHGVSSWRFNVAVRYLFTFVAWKQF